MKNTNGHGPERVILYTRVSREEQAKSGNSLAQQSEPLRRYADLEGYEILKRLRILGRAGQAYSGRGWTG